MNIAISANDHSTQVSQSFTTGQLNQLITAYFSPPRADQDNNPDSIDLLTTVVNHSTAVLFSQGKIPPLVSGPQTDDVDESETTLDNDAIAAAELQFEKELAQQCKLQICKQLAFNVTVYHPAKQAAVTQLLLTSGVSIFSLLDIYDDGISQSIKLPINQIYIEQWLASVMNVLFASQVPATLTAALQAAQGFELNIVYMGTMALEGQDPLGEHH
jgi:hypothetical protein